jgi:uncharacterized repeat protein (TIGR01451 family)
MSMGLEIKFPWSVLKVALLMALFLTIASGSQTPCGEGGQTCDKKWNLVAEDEGASALAFGSTKNLVGELNNLDMATVAFGFQNQSSSEESQNINTGIDAAKFIRLTAKDANNDLLSYRIVSLPSHGNISGTVPNIVYMPGNNYTGNDSFVFSASDEMGTIRNVTVAIDVLMLYHPPSVRIRSPQDGEIFTAYEGDFFAEVPIHATVTGEGVTEVEFYDGLTSLGNETCPIGETDCPVTLIAHLDIGIHNLIAKATDSRNKTCTSLPVVVIVNPAEPTAKITSPLDGEIFTAPEIIDITALVTTLSGVDIDRVEFYANSQRLGSVNASPYSFVWQTPTPGAYNLMAKVSDSQGHSSLSKSVLIVVVPVKPLAKSDLVLTMNISPDPVPSAGFMNYLLTVTNRGPDSATDVTVENFLPSELTNVTAKPSQGTYNSGIWELGSLTKYRSAKIVLTVQVPAVAVSEKIPNTAYVFGNEYDPDNSNNHDTAYIQVRADNSTIV